MSSFNRLAVVAFLLAAPTAVLPLRAASVLDQTGPPWLRLDLVADPVEVPAAAHESTLAPLSLAAADLDEDGVPDLVSGFGSAAGGAVRVLRGNVDAIYPDAPEARARRADGAFTDRPFLDLLAEAGLAEPPDVLVAGDFDADGHYDLVAAARGASRFWLLAGDGRGRLAAPRAVALPGALTALAAGDLNRRDGLDDLAVAVVGPGGPALLVLESWAGAANAAAEVIPLPAAASDLVVARVDGDWTVDVALACGREVVVVGGRDRRLTQDSRRRAEVRPPAVDRIALDGDVIAVAVADLVGGTDPGVELAALTADGAVRVLSRSAETASWQEAASATLAGDRGPSPGTRLVRCRLSVLPTDELAVLDPADEDGLTVVLGRPGPAWVDLQQGRRAALAARDLPAADRLALPFAAAAALPMRLNPDALSDLVVLPRDGSGPQVVASVPRATFEVDSTGNEADASSSDGICSTSLGTCTLRAALQQANASAGADVITFDIGSPLPFDRTITPAIALPIVTEAVTIDGFSQPAGKIVVSGTSCPSCDGFDVSGGGVTLRGLVIQSFAIGVQLRNGSGDVLEGNRVGTSSDGSLAYGCTSKGVSASSSGNTIGGSTTAARNLLSANQVNLEVSPGSINNTIVGNYVGTNAAGTADLATGDFGVHLYGEAQVGGTLSGHRNLISGNTYGLSVGSSGNLILRNVIGADPSGSFAVANENSGIAVYGGSSNTIGGATPTYGNLISGNGGTAVKIYDGASDNLVQANLIGTNASGTATIGNGVNGVTISATDTLTTGNTVGGTVWSVANTISGNLDGVTMSAGTIGLAAGNFVQGNRIGTDSSGLVALPNQRHGVALWDGASDSTVGGGEPGAGNVISGNAEHGLVVAWSHNIVVQGNLVGVAADGLTPLGNGGAGVYFRDNGSAAVVGGPVAGEGNVIAYNGGAGVACALGANHQISGNSIHSNGGLGVDLGDDGVTANDVGDADVGPNNLQNFPLVTAYDSATGQVSLSLSSSASATFWVEVYQSPACDPSGHGEGRQLLARTPLATGGTGTGSAAVTVGATPGWSLSALAIAANSDTSEFGPCYADPDLLFADGFESGDVGAWSDSVP